ncbi:hypothetical protein B7494_g3970 [Chlorociboria aeruginascens]|nr:hypothetical protein B7494_g3970 [Chlorociboria aeruginascens]
MAQLPLEQRALNQSPMYDATDMNKLAKRIWCRPGHPERVPRSLEHLSQYFKRLHITLSHLQLPNYVIQSYNDLFMILDEIKSYNEQGFSKSDLLHQLLPLYQLGLNLQDESRLQNSIELAIRVWMSIALGTSDLNLMTQGEVPLEWIDTNSIQTALQEEIRGPQDEIYEFENAALGNGRIIKHGPSEPSWLTEFSPLFNLRDLERIGGFEIHWTNDLFHHLYFVQSRSKNFRSNVYIYTHVNVLLELMDGNFLEKKLVKETLMTLALLIPGQDAICKAWYEKIAEADSKDGPAPQAVALPLLALLPNGQLYVSRRVNDYHFWRDRLLILEREFKNSEPGLRTWLHDRRRKREWFTFWFAFAAFLAAAVAVILGIWSGVTGTLSTVYAAPKGNDTSNSSPMDNLCCNGPATTIISTLVFTSAGPSLLSMVSDPLATTTAVINTTAETTETMLITATTTVFSS